MEVVSAMATLGDGRQRCGRAGRLNLTMPSQRPSPLPSSTCTSFAPLLSFTSSYQNKPMDSGCGRPSWLWMWLTLRQWVGITSHFIN